jgi:hypothetical protein
VGRLILHTVAELGTLPALWRYLRQHDSHRGRGDRLREGPLKGRLEWRRPHRMPLPNLLKPPI